MGNFARSMAAAALFSFAGLGTASADGMPRYGSVKDAPPPMAAYSWTGTYFGLHAGYGFGDAKLTDNLPTIGGLPLPTLSSTHEVDGFLGGIQLGARRQFGSLVFGTELSLSAGDITGNTGDCLGITSLINGLAPGVATASCNSRVNWIATALAKLGYAQGNWLLYGAAGWSVAGVDHQFTLAVNPAIIPLSISSGQNDVADGFTIGGGFEYAIGNGVSFGVEYLYRDLEHRGEGLLLGGILTTGQRDLEMHSITATMNVKW
jgi:outer membrane immunogenic protein